MIYRFESFANPGLIHNLWNAADLVLYFVTKLMGARQRSAVPCTLIVSCRVLYLGHPFLRSQSALCLFLRMLESILFSQVHKSSLFPVCERSRVQWRPQEDVC